MNAGDRVKYSAEWLNSGNVGATQKKRLSKLRGTVIRLDRRGSMLCADVLWKGRTKTVIVNAANIETV